MRQTQNQKMGRVEHILSNRNLEGSKTESKNGKDRTYINQQKLGRIKNIMKKRNVECDINLQISMDVKIKIIGNFMGVWMLEIVRWNCILL